MDRELSYGDVARKMRPETFARAVFGSDDVGICFIVGLALAVSTVRIVYETRGCYFFSDDFLNFIIAADMGPTWRYFVRDAQGELIPLYRAINIAYFHLFGLAFWPFRILLIFFQWAVLLITARIAIRRQVGPAVLLPVLTLLSCSPIFDTTYQWWSAAINVLCEALASLVAIWLMADTSKLSGSQKYGATLAFVTGMLFFPKAVFVAGILLSIRIFSALERGETLKSALVSAAREVWPVFLSGCVYAGAVIIGGYGSQVPPTTLWTVLHYIWHGWNHGFLTGILGLDHGFFGRVALANIAVASLMGISIARRPNAGVLWLGFAVFFVAAMGATAVNRAVIFGIESSEWGRYYADVLCFAVALFVIAGARSASAGFQKANRSWIWPSTALSMASAVYLLLAGGRVPFLWFVAPTRVANFVQNVSVSLAQADENAQISDGVVPDWVMPPWTLPLSEYHYFVMLFPHHRASVGANAQWHFNDQGTLVPVR